MLLVYFNHLRNLLSLALQVKVAKSLASSKRWKSVQLNRSLNLQENKTINYLKILKKNKQNGRFEIIR
jgi:hypothetical protein